ncbi:MAG: hypothetical protein MPL62_10025 [Alphaproteobacteria bacterium]|nr:hypothetical protein [Alphaproteobacteria bacterium]
MNRDRDTPQLARKRLDTSTWGKRLEIRAGLNDPLQGAPFGPFTQSPDAERFLRLVDVRAPTDRPSLISRDVVIYVTALQVYDNNPDIVDGAGVRISTPPGDQQEAHAGLFVRVETGRGGVTAQEDSVVPAHGLSLHIGADSARVSVGFFPSRTQWDQAPAGTFNGAEAAGFRVQAGVGTAGLYRDFIRQYYDIGVPNAVGGVVTSFFAVPPFARRLQFFHPSPASFTFRWRSSLGNDLVNDPLSALFYVDQPQPIPIEAVGVNITAPAGLSTNPILLWEREA